MSDLLIKGMEMPQGCFFCICNKHLDPDTDMCILTRDAFDSTFRVVEHRRDNCPLVPVPPHGRLIDADALMNEFKILQSGREIFGMELDSSFLSSGQELSTEWYCVEDAIEDAPTIIEAKEW